jgi:hypothetical protein
MEQNEEIMGEKDGRFAASGKLAWVRLCVPNFASVCVYVCVCVCACGGTPRKMAAQGNSFGGDGENNGNWTMVREGE